MTCEKYVREEGMVSNLAPSSPRSPFAHTMKPNRAYIPPACFFMQMDDGSGLLHVCPRPRNPRSARAGRVRHSNHKAPRLEVQQILRQRNDAQDNGRVSGACEERS